jgi:uncharacterized protein (DUF1810 family)
MQQLSRFLEAQENQYNCALSEIKSGRKHGHWMWYIFPQIKGLGFSSIANFYGIDGYEEAKAYINHEVLGSRLFEISNALLLLKSDEIESIFDFPDNLKLKSCMTLFAEVSSDLVFLSVINKYFKGEKDEKTIKILTKRGKL